jgi:hypothetical protein
LELTLTKQARVLHDWIESQHPTIARPSPKTIENNIRTFYNEHKPTK